LCVLFHHHDDCFCNLRGVSEVNIAPSDLIQSFLQFFLSCLSLSFLIFERTGERQLCPIGERDLFPLTGRM
ncbi:MAG TPA: hypothetical protein VEF33_10375, partial [Syntrophales bacterium]|nr:hypothetical protein [Syntrophales bacterium]